MKRNVAATVDEYIARFPPRVQERLRKIRATIQRAAPEAEERIAYSIPTYTLHGNLAHFAGYERHIGFYPGGAGIAEFKDELAAYPTSKGTVQLPLDRAVPYPLIARIVKFRVAQSLESRPPARRSRPPKEHTPKERTLAKKASEKKPLKKKTKRT